MIGGAPAFYLMCSLMILVNVSCYVMIQMYFEGHPAFDDSKDI
jgi:hypothetical protein